VETILNLFAGVGNVCALMLDREGNPVTEPSNACAFCSALRSSASAGQACRESWRELARLSPVAGQTYTMTCHAGLDYVVAPIFDHQQPVGWLVVGQFLLRGGDESEQVEQAVRLASEHQLPAMVLQSGLRAVPVVASDQLQQCERWALLAANAIESILKERAGFILRLQQIANLTQL
jgi:ligand-binding sensor protein